MSKQGKWNNHLKSYVNFDQGRRWPIFNGSWRGERWGTAPTCVGLEGSHYCVTSSARFYSFVCKLIVIFVHQQNPGCWEKLKRCCLGFLPSCSKKPAVQVNIGIPLKIPLLCSGNLWQPKPFEHNKESLLLPFSRRGQCQDSLLKRLINSTFVPRKPLTILR